MVVLGAFAAFLDMRKQFNRRGSGACETLRTCPNEVTPAILLSHEASYSLERYLDVHLPTSLPTSVLGRGPA